MIQARSHIVAMAPYALADLKAPAGIQPISLAQNESALPPSPKAVAAGRKALESSRLYPDPDWRDLRAAIAEVHGIPAEAILCGAGSMELIAALILCFAGPQDHVLSSQYGYAFFRTATLAAGATYVSAAEDNFTLSVEALLKAVTPETRILCLANPGNPTGTRIAVSDIGRLRDELAEDVLLLLDEAYGEFADKPRECTFDLVARGNTVILRTFSKAYGLAAMRVGWGLFPPAIAAQLRKIMAPNNITQVSQAAATAAMRDQDYMRQTVEVTKERRNLFAERLRALGLEVPESRTNFVLVRFADTETAAEAEAALRERGVLLRAMGGYGLADCLRATIGSDADMSRAGDVLEDWSKGKNRT